MLIDSSNSTIKFYLNAICKFAKLMIQIALFYAFMLYRERENLRLYAAILNRRSCKIQSLYDYITLCRVRENNTKILQRLKLK